VLTLRGTDIVQYGQRQVGRPGNGENPWEFVIML
jgi:hypothetical protein